MKFNLIDPGSIICDAKTGVSGAGKTPNATFHYPARYDAMNAYRISGHQHVYEIEREIGLVAGKDVRITFTPHVVPLCRGILTTLYAQLDEGQTIETVKAAYDPFTAMNPLLGFSALKKSRSAIMFAAATSAIFP